MRLTIVLLFLVACSASAARPGSGKHVVLVAGDDEYHSEQMKYFVEYVESGKPILAIRTATHAFDIPAGKTYSAYSWNREGGFGRRVLGETWVAHHGNHGKQSTRGRIAAGQATHPILRGIGDGEIWGPTDVYEVHLPERCIPLVMGEVLSGMHENDPPVQGAANHPMMPIAWTTEYKGGRVFVSTIGAADDFLNEGVRRLLVNAAIWAVGRENRIPARSDVRLVGEYIPKSFIE